jgi:hypothetical protein
MVGWFWARSGQVRNASRASGLRRVRLFVSSHDWLMGTYLVHIED